MIPRLPNKKTATRMARALEAGLAEMKRVRIRHGEALTLLARMHGLPSSNAFLALLPEEEDRSAPSRPAPTPTTDPAREALDEIERQLSAFTPEALAGLGLDVALEKARIALGLPADPFDPHPPAALLAVAEEARSCFSRMSMHAEEWVPAQDALARADAARGAAKLRALEDLTVASRLALASMERSGWATGGFWKRLKAAVAAVPAFAPPAARMPDPARQAGRGDLVLDLVGGLGEGIVEDLYINRHDDPNGAPTLICRFGDGEDATVADRLPGEVRPVASARAWSVTVRAIVRGDAGFLREFDLPPAWSAYDFKEEGDGQATLRLEALVSVTAPTKARAIAEAVARAPSTGVPHDVGRVEIWIDEDIDLAGPQA